MTAAMFELEDVRFTFGEGFALAVDSLAVGRRERVACIGPSGTGKTTLVGLVAGIHLPHAGRVRLAGETISELSDAERRSRRIRKIGMVFQELELLEYLTALENLLLPYHVDPRLTLDAATRERAEDLARALGISPLLRRRPRHLSQGERQRVAIGRALVTEPDLVICDEPTGNLDPRTAATTMELLFDQVARRGATLFCVTHDHGILDRFDRVVDVTLFSRGAT